MIEEYTYEPGTITWIKLFKRMQSLVCLCHPSDSGGNGLLGQLLRADRELLRAQISISHTGRKPLILHPKIKKNKSGEGVGVVLETQLEISYLQYCKKQCGFWFHCGWVPVPCYTLSCLWCAGLQVWCLVEDICDLKVHPPSVCPTWCRSPTTHCQKNVS